MGKTGSAGNVISGIASFLLPGLGQLVQGRLLRAVFQFVLASVLWVFYLGFLVHIWSAYDAATYNPSV